VIGVRLCGEHGSDTDQTCRESSNGFELFCAKKNLRHQLGFSAVRIAFLSPISGAEAQIPYSLD
jgi:hypothetical protein